MPFRRAPATAMFFGGGAGLRESRQQLYVALTRGRDANHLHLTPTGAGDQDDAAHPTLTRAETVHPDPLEALREVLARSDARPSTSSALTDAADPNRPLHVAVGRYLDAHTLHATTAGSPDALTLAVAQVLHHDHTPGVTRRTNVPPLPPLRGVKSHDGTGW